MVRAAPFVVGRRVASTSVGASSDPSAFTPADVVPLAILAGVVGGGGYLGYRIAGAVGLPPSFGIGPGAITAFLGFVYFSMVTNYGHT